jgi:hypothetical protein
LFTAVHEIDKWFVEGGDLFVSTGDIAFHVADERGFETIKLDIQRQILLDEEKLDIAILQLGPGTVEALAERKRFLQPEHLRLLSSPRKGRFILFGHPFFLADPGDPSDSLQVVKSPALWFDTSPADPRLREKHDEENNLLFTFPKGLDLHVQYDSEEPIKGLSGCGVWSVQYGRDLRLIDDAYLVGNFHHTSPSRGYVAGTSLRCVVTRLADEYPQIADVLNNIPSLE